jgi:hypothetical protein
LFPDVLLAALISRLSSQMLVARKKVLVAPVPIKICKASQCNIEILQTYKKILLNVRHNGLHNFSTTKPL